MVLLQSPEMLVGETLNLPVLKFYSMPVLFQILRALDCRHVLVKMDKSWTFP